MFRAWGRVGTTIGGNKLEKFASKSSAIDAFCKIYGEKTGNDWADRDNFVKHPHRFYPIDIDYGSVSLCLLHVLFEQNIIYWVIQNNNHMHKIKSNAKWLISLELGRHMHVFISF